LTIIGIIFVLQGWIADGFSLNFPLVFGITLIVLTWSWGKAVNWLKKTRWKKLKYITYGLIGIFAASFIFVESLIIFHRTPQPSHSDVIIVLGAGVSGDKPSWILENRLECAAEYLRTYPNAVAVVSGGLGPGKRMTEASVMKKYLLEKRVASERIIVEDKSTTTLENFEFSKKILEEKFGNTYSASYITNRFHVYRAGLIAKKMGLTVSGIAAEDVYAVMVSNYLREYFALMKYFLFSSRS